MDREKATKLLVEFFLDAFREDATGVSEYFDERDGDFDDFYATVTAMKNGN
jgi:predicted nucleic acid-binding protein